MRRGVAIALAGVLIAGCGGSHKAPPDATLHVTPASALIDAPANIDVAGLKGGDRVVVTATATDVRGVAWTGSESARADGRGDARLDAGTLLALMHAGGGRAISYLNPNGVTRVRLAATVGAQRVAGGAIARTIVAPGVRDRRLTVAHDGLAGDFFTSPDAHGTPVVAIGGSDGQAPTLPAALLAAHGHPTLSLSYFAAPGLPREMVRIPLEYFRRALRWVGARTGARRVGLVGVSRGGEGVLIIGSRYPGLVAGVAALVPGSQYAPSPTRRNVPAWTSGGRPLPLYEPIPVERIRGPVLTASAGQDAVWPSSEYATEIQERLSRSRFAHPDLRFPAAGHGIGLAVPYLPSLDPAQAGGTAAADAAARAALWPRLLAFLDGLNRRTPSP
jgi:dienelactone hydrolase